MKKIILSRDEGDNTISNWLSAIGFEVLTPEKKMDSWINGLVIGGGSDPGLPEDSDRDKMELELIKSAEKQGIPVLGICRGAEILTVWAGGSLSPLPSGLLSIHQGAWHKVLLSDLWPQREIDVWSRHHLMIENPGSLKPAAYSQHGSIEAIASPNKRMLGVLWHPERSGEPGYESIYPWLKWVEKKF